jgi:hypothetical protein
VPKRKIDLDAEGVTHYQLHLRKAKPVAAKRVRDIGRWRDLFHELEWIGQDPKRYRGVGFGNVSVRLGGRARKPRFAISGTQTGGLAHLTPKHYAIVIGATPEKNIVEAEGPVAPSSESMTHAVIYANDPGARTVIHVHAPPLWQRAKKLKMKCTPAQVPYGTPQMAAAVKKLIRSGGLRREKIFAMLGHRDGVVSYGRTAEEAGFRLIQTLAKIS